MLLLRGAAARPHGGSCAAHAPRRAAAVPGGAVSRGSLGRLAFRDRAGRSAGRATPLLCRAAAAAAAPTAAARPSSGECARTLVDICDRGTLATTTEDAWPMGTHAAYLLDKQGQPLLRLRTDALHTAHLQRDSRCSLYVQPFTQPGGVMSRATLLGRVEQLAGDALTETKERFAVAHAGRTGVDAVQAGDVYFRLVIERVFFVGGLGSDTRAEVVSGDAYRAAVPDPMRRLAPVLVRQMNEERLEDVLRFCESAGITDALDVSMLWVDRLGFDARAVLQGGAVHDVRITFARPVEKEQDAISQLTLLAQQLWEAAPAGRSYIPRPISDAAE